LIGRNLRGTAKGGTAASLAAVVVALGFWASTSAAGGVDARFQGTAAVDSAALRSVDSADAAAVGPDGRIIAAGSSNGDLALARYGADGSLDPSFGDRGLVTTDLGGDDGARAVAVEGDGSIVAAGASDQRSALVRYLPDGSLDPSFGDGGEVVGVAPCCLTSVAVQPDGKIVAAGNSPTGAYVARFDAEGSLDPTFGTDGRRDLSLGGDGEVGAVALQPDGDIVVAGGGFDTARLDPDGALDPSFGDGGVAAGGAAGSADALAIDPAGDDVVAGSSGGALRLVRYTAAGLPDPSFGTGGVARLAGPDVTAAAPGNAVAVEPDGTILAAGGGGGEFLLTRATAAGAPDPAFGSGGEATTAIGEGAAAAALVPDGTGAGFVAVGTGGESDADFALARYDADGSLDPSFGDAGVVTTNFSTAPPPPSAAPARPASAPGQARGHRAAARPNAKHHPHHHKPRRPGPPHAVPAWYINASSFEELKRFAANDVCAYAKVQPPKASRMLILDFGGGRAYNDGRFGAAVNHESFRATNSQILEALKVASDAYAACHHQGQAKILYANNNHFSRKSSAAAAHGIGAGQASTVADLSRYQQNNGYYPAERAGPAGDIETGYWGPKYSKQMVNGSESVWTKGYLDFGTAGGCPPHMHGAAYSGCFNEWTLDDVAHVSNSGGGDPAPEVYYHGGSLHFDQAAQWAHVARTWNSTHATPYHFFGATGSTEFSGLTPGQSWHRLRVKVPGHVGRELLNYKQDEWGVAKRGRGDGARR
jgi:uncharacterized delta-60 repeat protein